MPATRRPAPESASTEERLEKGWRRPSPGQRWTAPLQARADEAKAKARRPRPSPQPPRPAAAKAFQSLRAAAVRRCPSKVRTRRIDAHSARTDSTACTAPRNRAAQSRIRAEIRSPQSEFPRARLRGAASRPSPSLSLSLVSLTARFLQPRFQRKMPCAPRRSAPFPKRSTAKAFWGQPGQAGPSRAKPKPQSPSSPRADKG